MCIHICICAYGLEGSGPSPNLYIRLPDASLALRLSIPYLIQHPPHLRWRNWGLTRLWRKDQTELRDPFPDSLLRALWLLVRPCLAPRKSRVVTCFPRLSWHGGAGQMRSQAVGWHRVGCEPGPELLPLHALCEQAASFFSEAHFLHPSNGNNNKACFTRFWNELMNSLVITIWIGKYMHMDQTLKGSQRPSDPQPFSEKTATFIIFVSNFQRVSARDT